MNEWKCRTCIRCVLRLIESQRYVKYEDKITTEEKEYGYCLLIKNTVYENVLNCSHYKKDII